MFNLPKECYVNKFLPKKLFYEKVAISSGAKNEFTNLVERITWLYKIAPETIGIQKTEIVEEIQIFQIDTRKKKIPLSVIKTITKGVKYQILFLIKYNNDYCYAIKVDDSIYSSEWNDEIVFDFNAIDLGIVYENIVKIIINEEENEKKFEEIIEDKNNKIDLEKKINQLKQKVKNEKQFDRKVQYNMELNELKNKLTQYRED